jgi:hypothetical protein
MKFEVGLGKLWMDGSGKVSVPVSVPVLFKSAAGSKYVECKVLDSGDVDKTKEHLRAWALSFGVCLSEQDAAQLSGQVAARANEARADSGQQKAVAKALRQAAAGAKSSRRALDKRNLELKCRAFKEQVQDLVNRGMTQKQLQQLVREAICEGVHQS